MQKQVALVGLATLDYVATATSPLRASGTVNVALNGQAWPRAGGAPLYAGKRLAAGKCGAWPLVAVGNDLHADAYLRDCLTSGLSMSGIKVVPGAKTPSCVLIHHDSGGYNCFLDMGSARMPGLMPRQAAIVDDADLVVFTAGEPDFAAQVLARLPANRMVAWIFKDDPDCFPPDLCAALARRSDVIFSNQAERDTLARHKRGNPREHQIHIETQGAKGVLLQTGSATTFLTGSAIAVHDTTGAGDTLAGEALAMLLEAPGNPAEAVHRGMRAAATLLQDRQRQELACAAP
jgi:ribokinase